MKAFRLHLRTAPTRWLWVPFLAIDLVVLLLRGNRHWIGSWSETGAAGQLPAFFLSMLAAGAAAWASGVTRRHRIEEQLSAAAVSRPVLEAHRLGAVLVPVLIPYLLGQAVAFTLTARTFPTGVHLWVGYLFMGATLLVLATAWGWGFGKHLGATFAALCASLSWVMVVFFFLRAGNGGVVVVSGPVWQEVDLVGASLRLATALLLGLFVLWIPLLQRRPSGDWAAPLLSMAVALGALVAVGSTPGVVDRRPPAEPVCVDGAMAICLWPEHEKYLPMARALNDRVSALPDGFVLPERLAERACGAARYMADGPRVRCRTATSPS